MAKMARVGRIVGEQEIVYWRMPFVEFPVKTGMPPK
jgi:hypothetical protein